MAQNKELIVGLDIGTTKICAIVAEIDAEGAVDIVGIGTHPSNGMRKGVVINIDATVNSIKAAVREAELMADVRSIMCTPALQAGTSKVVTVTVLSLLKTKRCLQKISRG